MTDFSVDVEVYGANFDELIERAVEKARAYWPEMSDDQIKIHPFTATPATETMNSVESWTATVTVSKGFKAYGSE